MTLPGPTRLRGIDALRGIAALGVVLYHAVEQGKHVLPNNILEYPIRMVQFGSSFGYIGVFLFFVISGFCIHLQWAKSKAAGLEPEIRFGPFWKRRIRRLYPPYVIALLFYLLLTAWTIGLDVTHFLVYDVVMHLLMLHNLDPHTCYTINGVFWTLATRARISPSPDNARYTKWNWSVTPKTSAPDPWFVNVPALSVALPARATGPTSVCCHGSPSVPPVTATLTLTAADVVTSPPLSVARTVKEWAPAGGLVQL